MAKNLFEHIVHGGDYNPDQWIKTPEIWDEDMRLMKLAHINSATVGIFSWSLLEPEEGVYNFEWLDTIMDKLHENGIGAILSTPSGARPPWLSQKYPEVLRIEQSGIRNEFGIRHNHCLTSPIYRKKVAHINRKLAERYADHPALKMWHISNEYSGCCHCELCQASFREWLKKEYNNDIEALNEAWWGGFWAHRFNDWDQISSPKFRGETSVPGLKLSWSRFVTDSHISFLENELAPIRELTPDIPVTTNFMNFYPEINYQKMAKHLDIISWDNYPSWGLGDDIKLAAETGFSHDANRCMGGGKPFFMMESSPSNVNWKEVNRLPEPTMQALSSIQAVAHGADSVQYFQWRKSRGSHEKFHGAVVDHCGHENTRVFRQVAELGKVLEKLDNVKDVGYRSRVAVICDWENMWATTFYFGYNNLHRDYVKECVKWYTPFYRRGISVDVVAMDDDLSEYELVIAPYLYLFKNGTGKRLDEYVNNGGKLVMTYLTGVVDKDDLCYLGGLPGDGMDKVLGIWAEETDSLPDDKLTEVEYNGKTYSVDKICDIIHTKGASVLGTYKNRFYAGTPSVTENIYGKGTSYYVAFRNDGNFADDFCGELIKKYGIESESKIKSENGVFVRRRGELIFVMNFSDENKEVKLDREYVDVVSGEKASKSIRICAKNYLILK